MSGLWSHQTEFINLADRLPNCGALMRPGSGKTRAMVETLRKQYNRDGKLSNTLIFAPPLPCQGWKREILAHTKIPEDRILVLTMPGAERTKRLKHELDLGKPCIVVTNYEAVQIEKFYEEVKRFSPAYTVLDESHRVKDSGGVRAKRIYPLTDAAKRRFILTGTLTPNSLLDVFGQFRAMNPALLGESFWQFRSRHFYDENAGMPAHVHFPNWIPRPECAEWFGKLIADNCVQAGEAADLPPLQEIVLPVELGKAQRKAYEGMVKEFVAEFNSSVAVAEFAMTKTVRLRQILCGFLQPDDGAEPVWFDEVPRLSALADLLDSLKGEKVLIWTEFRATYKKLGQLCEKMGFRVGFLTGEQSAKQKTEIKTYFQGNDLDVLICNPAAAGEGTDGLQVARYAVYFARSYNSLHFEQSKARNHRGGSGRHSSVCHYHLRTEGTLDEVIHEALTGKKEVSESILTWARKLATR